MLDNTIRQSVAALVAAAAFVLPSIAFGQQAQQTEADVPDDWPEQLGVCRRTLADCVGKSTAAIRLESSERIDVDGQLDETVWDRAIWFSDFIQRDPIEGSRPTVRTEVAFAYDETHLYVAGRMYDPNPSEIRANLARRDDNGGSDRLKIAIDSYQNRQTYYNFSVTAAGGRLEYFGSGDADDHGDRDYSYNPIWSADARVTDEGWFAEMAIPFSQLRFTQADEIEFGININRFRPVNFEDLFWTSAPKDENGFTSWFGDLTGLVGVQTRRPIEFVPYLTSNLAVTSDELLDPDNPFSDHSDIVSRFGADIKMGIGSGLTLDATFNPDFGQVEADPAEVNLSAFPTFFREQRPFFVENAELLEANDLFFSRRIGSAPHGSPGETFADVPANTTILGAAKLTGRTSGGLSIGVLGAMTSEESAATFDDGPGTFGETRVEPTTGWLVLRGLQEFGTAKSTVGLAFTGVTRDLSDGDALADRLNKEAYAFAADAALQFRGGLTELKAIIQGSHISGTPAAISRVQQFSSHYFQRPDADHVEFDPTRTSLSGYRGFLSFEHRDGEHWEFETQILAVSPEFDINDAGALGRADRITTGVDLEYRENTVGKFRSWRVGIEADDTRNFDGDHLGTDFEVRAGATLLNFWSLNGELDVRPAGKSDTQTRGGPLMGTPRQIAGSISMSSAFQNRLSGSGQLSYANDEIGGWWLSTGVSLRYQPGGAWQFSAGPSFSRNVNARQYVTNRDDGRAETFGKRYIFAELDRTTLSMQLRANYAFHADLSLEAYLEPFAAAGSYSNYGELFEPGTTDLRFYGVDDGTTISESTGNAPHLITVQDGADQFSFSREDFRALSFRSNLVMRWEWSPGSTIFLVWQLDRGGFGFENGPGGAGFGDLLDSPGELGRSFFAVKATYWLPI